MKKFNVKQYIKIKKKLLHIIDNYIKTVNDLNFICNDMIELKNIVNKLNKSNIVSQKIRKTYYLLMKKLYSELSNDFGDIAAISDIKHINIYEKVSVGHYIDKNFVELYVNDITKTKDNLIFCMCHGNNDNINISIKRKIKTYLDSTNKEYYKLEKDKCMSTNLYALFIINDTIDKLKIIKEIILSQKNKLKDIVENIIENIDEGKN